MAQLRELVESNGANAGNKPPGTVFPEATTYSLLLSVSRQLQKQGQPGVRSIPYIKGERIYNDFPTSLWLLEEGRVKIGSKSENGDIAIHRFLTAPTFFGEEALGDMGSDEGGIPFAEALSNCRTIRLTTEAFEAVLKSDSNLAMAMLPTVLNRTRDQQNHGSNILFCESLQLLAHALSVDLIIDQETQEPYEIQLEQLDISSYIGRCRELVNEDLQWLVRQGIVALERRSRITILNRQSLLDEYNHPSMPAQHKRRKLNLNRLQKLS